MDQIARSEPHTQQIKIIQTAILDSQSVLKIVYFDAALGADYLLQNLFITDSVFPPRLVLLISSGGDKTPCSNSRLAPANHLKDSKLGL